MRAPSLLALVAAATAACAVSHRSNDFACDDHTRCAEDRVCVDGLCVLADAPPIRDAGVCPAACTSCSPGQNTCTIDCALNGGCAGMIACPAGWSCNVLCSTSGSCRNGVSCPDGASCTVSCSGSRSCQGIHCGTGRCSVGCTGSGSCRDVACDSSCACDVSCAAVSACDSLACTPGCTGPLRGCVSTGAGCTTCK